MSPLVLDGDRALIFDRETGEVMRVSVPTAIENVKNGQGRFVHGSEGDRIKGKTAKAHELESPPVIPLTEPDVLPLPEAEQPPADPLDGADDATREAIEGRIRPVSDEHVHEPAAHENPGPAPEPLGHDANGKKGGAKKSADPERAAVIKALKAAKIKFFAGKPTSELKALLPG